jgi:hypothetical protein
LLPGVRLDKIETQTMGLPVLVPSSPKILIDYFIIPKKSIPDAPFKSFVRVIRPLAGEPFF